jgi:Flp pilus assembly pilin Flp
VVAARVWLPDAIAPPPDCSRLQKLRKPAMREIFVHLCSEDGQDIAEYAVMVAVILLIVVGTLRLIGSNSNTVFSSVASAIG